GWPAAAARGPRPPRGARGTWSTPRPGSAPRRGGWRRPWAARRPRSARRAAPPARPPAPPRSGRGAGPGAAAAARRAAVAVAAVMLLLSCSPGPVAAGAGSGLPAPGRRPRRPPWCRPRAPARPRRRRSPGSSQRLAVGPLAPGRERLQERGEFSLDLDDPAGFGQLHGQARVLPAQAGHLLLQGVGLRRARGRPPGGAGPPGGAAGAR